MMPYGYKSRSQAGSIFLRSLMPRGRAVDNTTCCTRQQNQFQYYLWWGTVSNTFEMAGERTARERQRRKFSYIKAKQPVKRYERLRASPQVQPGEDRGKRNVLQQAEGEGFKMG